MGTRELSNSMEPKEYKNAPFFLKLFRSYFEKVARESKDGPFTLWQLFCARRLCDFAYFKAVQETMKDPDIKAPPRWKGA